MIIDELSEKHRLTKDEVMNGVEVAIARVMTRALKNPVAARVEPTGELTVIVFHEGSPPGQMSASDIPDKLLRHILHEIQKEMELRKNVYNAEKLRDLQGKTVDGEVAKIAKNGSLIVAVETERVFQKEIWFAECPYFHIPQHERSIKLIGRKNKFLVTSVQAISDGTDSRLRMRLSRTSPLLPPSLLSELTGVPGIVCTKRIPGAYSDICSPVRLVKSAINEVGKEIQEKLNVRFSDKIVKRK